MHYVGFYNNLIKSFAYLIVILSIAFCKNNMQSALDEMISFNPAFQSVAFNIEEGCVINPITSDSIQSITNSLGDDVKAGVPGKANANYIDRWNLAKPKLIYI